MTKLDANNRWQTKMMLTEHVEALKEHDYKRNNPTAAIEQKEATRADLMLIRTYILLPMLRDMVDRTMTQLDKDPQPMRQLYMRALTILHARIGQDLLNNKKSLQQQNIRIWKSHQEGSTAYYKYLCSGREGELGIDRDFAKQSINLRISEYVNALLPIGPKMIGAWPPGQVH
ncbi:hypothetical protein ACFSR7_06050 [Cohnella sp. GCM10020058]|uniref:hypothetical protein n=1 Tax=Cohnella sp. GCM10020058 TaxID=3317330 RepID=UPI00363E2AE4